jgi:hypothetical protein
MQTYQMVICFIFSVVIELKPLNNEGELHIKPLRKDSNYKTNFYRFGQVRLANKIYARCTSFDWTFLVASI